MSPLENDVGSIWQACYTAGYKSIWGMDMGWGGEKLRNFVSLIDE